MLLERVPASLLRYVGHAPSWRRCAAEARLTELGSWFLQAIVHYALNVAANRPETVRAQRAQPRCVNSTPM
ncbi:hypothetical protein GCM10009105_23090 [Dokdonella soli]|uniref:Uncharacterized protein n=1 Tax=Dokdonella soli TaxID=529810 RepID=A0ABN1IL19_9GAMM